MNSTELSKLNEAQLKAVTAMPSNLLVLAGAGSGKTRVIVERISWLLQQGHVSSPNEVLAVTFTNKAAREMRNRLSVVLKLPLHNMWIGTFHGIAHRLLRAHWQEANLIKDFQIMDADDQLCLIKQVHKSLNLVEDKFPAKQSQWFINTNKDEGFRPQDLQAQNESNATLIDIYRAYVKACKTNGLIDFADLLLHAYDLWRNNSDILNQYQNRFRHVLVDEFQDTNNIQYAWLRLLIKGNYLTAVGDDDQSIYRWRGARMENMHNLVRDLPNVQTIRLEQNYRSTGNILKAANSIILNNVNRLGKNLWTEDDQGELISLYSAINETEEAGYVVDQIEKYLNEGVKLNEMAVLYRSNAQSRAIEEQLLKYQIPYQVYGNVRFFERAEVKDALAYLRLLVNPNDDTAFTRILNMPPRGIGKTTLNVLRQYADGHKISLWEAAQIMVTDNKLAARATSALTDFLKFFADLNAKITTLPLAKQIETVLVASGLYNHFASAKSEIDRMRTENLDELVSVASRFVQEDGIEMPILNAFLTRVILDAGDDSSNDEDGVQLMTLHSAKGLEFPIVFLVGVEQGLLPHELSLRNKHDIEEERRLCYVGITRAMKKLFLTYAKVRRLHGVDMYRFPSKFLTEIPMQLLSLETSSRY